MIKSQLFVLLKICEKEFSFDGMLTKIMPLAGKNSSEKIWGALIVTGNLLQLNKYK